MIVIRKNKKDVEKIEDGVAGYNRGYADRLDGKTPANMPWGQTIAFQKGWRVGFSDAQHDMQFTRRAI